MTTAYLKLFVALAAITSIVTSCATGNNKTPQNLNDTSLSQAEAELRFSQVSDVSYDLKFSLQQKSKKFSGVSKLEFNYTTSKKDLRIDFFKGKVDQLKVNGQLQEADYNGKYISINKDWLSPGKNNIEIQFHREFNGDGRGFVRFVDPEDNRVYTYTQLEPFKANFVFPCFDQPDLKATYKMLVTAPKSWEVITSVRENKKTTEKNNFVTWHFPRSEKFSTYIWSLHAGEYSVFEDKYKDIPLRLFVRKSLAKYVKTKDWFYPTKQGLAFFPKYFSYKYPYKKYDSIVAPEFTSGAMENVAAVTFNESFVSRGTKQRSDQRSLASVILHEMAHMWFGNLVTMKWWDDLWLNESFATYMASLALHDATKYKESWRGFNGTKQWAYWEDQLVTTHPIEAKIPDTATAMSNFDGITYGKGAATMKQLSYYIDPEKFQKGLQIYFKRHAEGNTKLKDFIKALGDGSGQDLVPWQKSWLQTANLNTISISRQCDGKHLKQLTLTQTAPKDYPTIRPHRFEVATLELVRGKYKTTKVYPVKLTTDSTNIAISGKVRCDALLDLNHKDYGYFKANLDKTSIKQLKSNILKVTDNFQRQLYWTSLWDMVREGQLDAYTYIDIALENLPKERDNINLRKVLGQLTGRRGGGPIFYMPKEAEVEKATANKYAVKIEKLLWRHLIASSPASDTQKIWFDSFTRAAQTKWGLDKLESLVTKNEKLKGLHIDQDRRWKLITRLSAHGTARSAELIDAEAKTDKSNTGGKSALSAKAAFPNWETKSKWITELKKKKTKYKQPELEWVMWSLFPENQAELRKNYADSFYQDLLKVEKLKGIRYATSYTAMAPDVCTPEKEAKVTKFLAKYKESLHPVLNKRLKVMRQESGRCHKIRMTAKNALKDLTNPQRGLSSDQ